MNEMTPDATDTGPGGAVLKSSEVARDSVDAPDEEHPVGGGASVGGQSPDGGGAPSHAIKPVRSRRAMESNLPYNWSQWTVCPMCRSREALSVEKVMPQCRFCWEDGSVVYLHWIDNEHDDPWSLGSFRAPLQVDGRRW